MASSSLRSVALATSAVFSACQMMAFVLYPYFAESMRLSLTSIISSFSLGSFLFIWGSPYWARRSESWGQKPVLAIGLSGLVLAQITLLFLIVFGRNVSSEQAALCLWSSRILYGLTASAIVPVAQTIMAEASGSAERMKAMTRHSMSLHVGRLLGPFIVWISLLFSAATPLWILTGVLFVLLLVVIFLPQSLPIAAAQKVHPRWYWPSAAQSRLLIGIAFGVTCLVGVMQSSLTRHLQINFQLNSHDAAQITLRFLLASSLLTLVIQGLLQAKIKGPWQGTFPVGAICLLISSLMLAQFHSDWELWWALPLFAAGLALLTPSYTAALSLQEALTQGQTAGLLAVAHTLGYTVGGLLSAGFLALNLSPLWAGPGVAVVLLLAIISLKSEPEPTLHSYQRDSR